MGGKTCKKYDVAIIGGGVIGSSVAHFLAERGHKVAIVEKQQIASEASKAAAGLLGVQAEWDAYDPLFDLARKPCYISTTCSSFT